MDDLALARGGDSRAFETLVAPHRRELRAFCYRMAGSIDDADDLLQESLLRAWRGLPQFEGRASFRTWLYRVTSSACIDRLKSRSARKRVEESGPPARADEAVPPPSDADTSIGPCPASVYATDPSSPEARYSARESVGFAFLAALQLLPPKQRATLIACDVIGLTVEECASVLDVSASSVESAIRRARDAIAERTPTWSPNAPDEPATAALLARYIDAWDRADAAALVKLLHEEATMSMPPLPIWLEGPTSIGASIDAMVFASCAQGTFRMIHTEANGLPALGVYRRGADGAFAPYALQVLALDGDALRAFTAFLDTRLFVPFELPPSP